MTTIEDIAAFDGRIAKIEGSARSGKTEALVARCVTLLESGCAPSDILVATSSSMAAQAFRNRLRKALPEDKAALAGQVNVETALNASIAVLNTDDARKATGRIPRLLTSAEYNFFLEDMKTTGEQIRKLRNMLKYFLRELANYTPRDKWNIGGEEQAVLDHMNKVLTLRDAMLPEEVAATCADYLQSDAGKGACKQFKHVLADDFQNFTRAEQTCLCLLAGEQIMVAGNANEAVEQRTGCVCAEGFTEFDTKRKGVDVFRLNEAFGNGAVQAFADGLLGNGDMDASLAATSVSETKAQAASEAERVIPAGASAIKWTNPDDEMNGLTKYLRVLMNKQDEPLESHTCVVVPNRRWASLAKRVLKSRGFNVSDAGAYTTIGGDPRNSKRALALVAYTKLSLLADPTDMVAWRSWCGIDHALTNSFAWMGLQDWALDEGISLYEALERVGNAGFGAKEPFPSANNLAEKWRAGQDFIAKNAARKGYGLLKCVGADSLAEFEDIANAMLGNENAKQLFEMMYQFVTDPVWPEDPHVLHVSSMYTLAGTSYDTMYVMGAIDGFIPQRNAFEIISTDEARDTIMNSERKAFHSCISKAEGLLTLSYFSKSALELAEKTKMQVIRVKSEGDARIAIVRPTNFLMQAGNGAPSTTGGQALLAEYGLN